MRAIKARGNRSTEARFRSILIRAAIRGWKLQPKGVLGKPDFYFPDQRVAIFVDRCFWHGCPECDHIPKGNRPYWEAKIDRNRERDSQTTACLLESGYVVVRFWEHELQHDMANCLQRIRLALQRRDIDECMASGGSRSFGAKNNDLL
jgi:DNA mismatch endonuclease Vsr